ncbi:TadE family protein [Streptomyces sp. NPDC001515]
MVTRTLGRPIASGATESPAYRSARHRGQAAVEYVGVLTLLLITAMAVVQLGIAVYAKQQASTAARAGARVESDKGQSGRGEPVAIASLSRWLRDDVEDLRVDRGYDSVSVKVEIHIPSVVPMFDFGNVEKRVTMPRDHR